MIYSHEEIMTLGQRSAVQRKLLVMFMKLDVFGRPGYMRYSDAFIAKYRYKLAKGEELWP